MTAKAAIVRSVALLCFAFAAASLRSDAVNEYQRDRDRSLSGVGTVPVVAAITDKREVTDAGVTNGWIKQVAELRLRRNGIVVISTEEAAKKKGGCLNVAIDVMPPDAQEGRPVTFVFSISVSFDQLVTLERNPEIRLLAGTWSELSFGTAGINRFKSAIQDAVEDQVDAFSNTYLAQNPKK